MSKVTQISQRVKTEQKVPKVLRKPKEKRGLEIPRYFTKSGKDPLDFIEYELRSCKITNPDGSVIFEMEEIEIPKSWSKVASDVLISKYIRKGGVPQFDKFSNPIKNKDGSAKIGAEKSVRQVVRRLAGCWRYWGEKYKYFATQKDAQAFEDELIFMLVNQYGAPNSPQWFNTGLNWAYKISGPAQGHWYADAKSGKLKLSEDAYTHPQPHACFIQSISDNLVNKGGIFDLLVKEARIFKYGSGNGTNYSCLRAEGEPLSGGGKSSGLMSWLKIFDVSAGGIKSGGTTRRASKMVVLNADHPDIEKFVQWKYHEEQKAASLIAEGYSTGIDGEAYSTVSGQNSNNSVRVTDEFMQSVENDSDWHLRWRVDPEHIAKTIKAKDLFRQISQSTWQCGDPGIQFDTTANGWHTCLASGRINASNPCSEFMFLDDSSCNLASLNLVKFFDEETGLIKIDDFRHAVRLWTVVLELSVLMAQFPSYEIAKNSYSYRPLGLGYANIGALLMMMGLPYDSKEGRAISASITALMTGEAYAASAEMAKHTGTFKMYDKNKADMLRVIRNHRRAVMNAPKEDFEGLSVTPQSFEEELVPDDLARAARESWDKALLDGGRFGFKNAQVTLLAPTGTIGLLMDCDTTGVEPDYALVKFKKLAGGGYFKIINQSVPRSLKKLGYSKDEVKDIIQYIVGSGNLDGSPHINSDSLLSKGLSEKEINEISKKLLGAFDLNQAFTRELISDETFEKISLKEESGEFDLLSQLGFSKDQIREANEYICGIMTIEGAPLLKDEHLAVFDCANKCGQYGKRFIAPRGHLKMMAAVQPFLSGAISKTVNMSNEVTVEDIEKTYLESWKLGIKAIAIYRDGSKLTQPLNAKKDNEEKAQVEKEIVIEYRPIRKRMPKQRSSVTRKVTIGGHKMFLTVGLYENNKPGELFIIMNQQGSFAAGMADSFAKMVSIGLQYGVPIETIVSQLRHMRFQPMGFTGDSDISNASSISDFIAQWFQRMFLGDGLKAMKLPFEDEKKEESINVSPKAENKMELKNQSQKSIFSEDLGFSGEMCPDCGLATMVLNGKCYKCVNCGATTGCS
ncbi:MAG: adenosylcobalamin-dependent ribonucleoside-diphosphate reductase [Candidatus Berkelbacteria bacterium]|nr:adenosylcobalamin-dependent ribonucleoside-diphosphate reductase [Candidatus Berkelbacteria bacterium]